MGDVGGLAVPVADIERADQVAVGGRIPAFIDTVRNAAEQALVGLAGEETVEAAPKLRGGDFLGVSGADRGDMARIGHTGLKKRQLAVELHALLLQGVGRDPQLRAAGQADHALVGEVMDGEQGRRVLAAPVHIGRSQASRPVVGMDQVGGPVDLCQVGSDIGGGQAQAGEADMVVRPIAPVVGAIGGAFTLE